MKITIYTTNSCAYCAMVKRYLDSKSKTYEVVNLDDHPELREGLYERTGAMTVPISHFQKEDGSESFIIGWKPAQIAEAIK